MNRPLTREDVDAILAPIIADAEAWRAAAEQAGPNIMAHHDPGEIRNGGMAGGMEMLLRMWSPEKAKFNAGAWLVEARKCRIAGRMAAARYALGRAMGARRRAKEYSA